jgi:hypothetical protein
MAKPNSRQELVDYCLRALGAPVIEINIDDDQIGDRLDDAIQFYQEYHGDATLRRYRKHQITGTDVTNQYIDIPDTYIHISRVLPFRSGTNTSAAEFNVEYQMMLNDVYDLRGPGSILHYAMSQMHLAMVDQLFDGKDQTVRFNRHMNRLFIETRWGTDLKAGEFIIIEGYETINPSDFRDVYNDIFLKRYLTALLKRQWGTNLKKFGGMQLPGGVEINGQQIFDEANEEITTIEEEMQLRYEMPPMDFMG